MKNKISICIVACMLLMIGSVKAQNQIILPSDDDEVIIIEEEDSGHDTISNELTPTPIEISYRKWDNLEKNLKDEVTRLSNDQCKARTISNERVGWAYRISDIPTVDGKKTIYLLVLKNKEGCLASLNNPNEKDVLAEYCIKLATPGKHQTDDSAFGQPVSNGSNREIKTVDF